MPWLRGLHRGGGVYRLGAVGGAGLAVLAGPRDRLQALQVDDRSRCQLRLIPSHRDVENLRAVRPLRDHLDDPQRAPGLPVLPLNPAMLAVQLRLRRLRGLEHVPRRVEHETHVDLLRSRPLRRLRSWVDTLRELRTVGTPSPLVRT